MILTVDIGNSTLTLGGFSGEKLVFVSHIATDTAKCTDEYAISFRDVLSLYRIDPASVTGAIVASVVPPLNGVIEDAIRFLFRTEPLFVGPGIKSGISIRCDIPSSVGADLIAAAVAVGSLYKTPALIIDMGTATKMTLVDKNGAFIGTSIIPGVMMGLNALSEKTAQLPRISLSLPASVIGKNTRDCMCSGVLYGNASLVDGMIDRIVKEYGEALSVYATGDMAETILPLCQHTITLDEHLVLKGLHLLYRKNRP